MAWIIRLFLVIAAPVAALLVARDSLNFDIVQSFVAMFLMIALLGVAAIWSGYRAGSPHP